MTDESRRPPDRDFYQQRLKAWQPILTPKWVMITFFVIGVVFVPLGFVFKIASDNVVEHVIQYDGEGVDSSSVNCVASKTPTTCTISFETSEEMKAPVYVYYELDNFYQNHRRYVKSRSDQQLREGKIFPEGDLSSCDPLVKDGKSILHPCGLIANSFFNDKFNLQGSGFTMLENDIAWKSDREHKFKKVPDDVRNTANGTYKFLDSTYPDYFNVAPYEGVENEHFIVWMRTAALPRFRKLYGRIEKDIPKGTKLEFAVQSNFDVDSFKGKKSLVVSTTSWLGGKNAFLGIAYIVVGFVCIALGIAFAVKQKLSGRRLGDTDFLSWNARR